MDSVAITHVRQEYGQFTGLVWTLIRTDFKTRYHGTIGGFVWALLKPLTMFLVLLGVFSYVFAADPDIRDVGFDLFQSMLKRAVDAIRKGEQPDLDTWAPRISTRPFGRRAPRIRPSPCSGGRTFSRSVSSRGPRSAACSTSWLRSGPPEPSPPATKR